ncbi:carph-isopro domain-containing protein [Acidovorax delafieldii]|uniref:carph-isopro domain-containing protein n=1 Tax=Acidovorax delafieldii TaxID=47920 RepID=UPI003F4F4D8A
MHALELIDALGGTYVVAELAGVKPPSVSGWKEAGRIPDAKLIRLAPIAEQRGIATRKGLFPNDWQEIWPELVGPEDLQDSASAKPSAAEEHRKPQAEVVHLEAVAGAHA